MDISSYISTLSIPYRGDCPGCSGKNTFSVNIKDGYKVWRCFRSSCIIKGKISNGVGLETLYDHNNSNIVVDLEEKYRGMFFNPLQNSDCYKYMQLYKLMPAYIYRYSDIRYDPKQHRIVFFLKDHKGVIHGATGRTLNYHNSPKWTIYDRVGGCPFIYKHKTETRSCILVEDAISAINAGNINSSIALLGTTINETSIQYLLAYDILYIALDDDATSKALELQHILSSYRPTKIIPLLKDLKYYSSSELIELQEKIRKENIQCQKYKRAIPN